MYSHYYYPNELYHHGVKGQKWGVRRFQNRDGSLTSAGERHRDQIDGSSSRSSGGSAKSAARKKRLKRILGATLGAAAVAGAAYGIHKTGGTRHAINSAKHLASRFKNKAGEKYLDARSGYKNSKLGRKIATEKFKYQNGLGAVYGAKTRAKGIGNKAWDTVNRGYEKASLYGHKAKNAASNVASRGYERAALYGHKAKNAAVDSAYRVGERADLYSHKVSSVPSKVRRFYTTSGGARGLAADAKAGVRSAASRFGSGAANAARTAGGALDRTIGVKARYAKLTAQDAYQKRKKKRYYKNYNRPIDVAYTVS